MQLPTSGPKPALKPGYYILNTDGGMAAGHGRRRVGDPLGCAAIGVLLRTRDLATVAQIAEIIGPATHNVAEYQALIKGLRLAHDYGIRRIRVYMDSELVVNQMNGDATVREVHLTELRDTAWSLRASFENIRISWVPRKMNAEADQLVRDALGAVS